MNQKYYTVAIAALFGLIIGSFVGGLLDQAIDASVDPNRLGAFNACNYCPDALFPYMGEIVKTNIGSIFGAVAGLGVGVLFGWALMGSAARSNQNNSGATFGSKGDDTLVASRASLTQQTIEARAAPADENLMRQLESLTALSKGEASLHESFDPQKILMRAHDEAVRVTGADYASLILLDWNSPQRGKATRVGTTVDYDRFSPSEENVLATNRSLIIGDYQNEPEAPIKVGIRSSLLVPIAYDERVIGLIGLHSETVSAFNAETQEVVELLAAQTAIALGNARRYEEQIQRGEVLRGRAEQLQSLFKIATSIQPEHSLAANLERIAFGIQQSAGYNIVIVSVANPKSNQLNRVAAAGVPAATFDQLKQTSQTWELYHSYLRAEFQLGTAYFIPHEQATELYRPLDILDAAKPAEKRGPEGWHRGDVLLLPIYGSAGDPLGIIQLDDPRSGKAPTQATVEVLELFTGPSMLVVENSRLLDAARERINESRDRAQQLEALGEASHIIARTLRREEVVSVSLEQLRRVVPYDRATLYLRDVADGRFRVSASRIREGEAEWIGMAPELLDRSLFAEISANRRVLVVPDISNDSRFPKSSQQVRGAWLGVPLMSKGDVVGVLGLDKLDAGYYTAGHTHVATAFANQMSAALENAGLYEAHVERAADLSERFHRLALFNNATSKTIDPADAELSSRTVLQGLMDAIRADSGSIFLFHEGTIAEGLLTQVPGGVSRTLTVDQLGTGDVIRRLRDTRKSQVLYAVRESSGQLLGAPATQVLALPLLVNNALIGVLALGRTQEEDEFGAADIEAGETVALQAAALLHGSRLLADTRTQLADAQYRARQLDSVNSAAPLITASLRRDEAMDVSLAQLAQIVAFDNATLYWRLPDDRRFTAAIHKTASGDDAVELEQPDQSLFEEFLDNRRPVVIGNIATDERFGIGDAATPGAWLGVPLVSRGEVVGLLALYKAQPNYYNTTHAVAASAFASYVSVALENARLFEENIERTGELNDRINRLSLLNGVTSEIIGSLDVERSARTVLKGLSEVLAAESAVLLILDETSSDDGLIARLSGEAPERILLEELGAVDVVQRLRETRQPVLFAADESAWVGQGVQQSLAVPLIVNDVLTGLLAFGRSTAEPEFTKEEIELARGAAAQAAVMVQNTRLYQKSQQRLIELSSVSQTSRALVTELDFKRLVDVIRAQVAGLTGAQHFVVALYDDARNELTFPVAVEDGRSVEKAPIAPGSVSQYIIQSRQSLLLGSNSAPRLRAAGVPDITSRVGAWDAVSGESYLGLPLMVGNRLVGIIQLADSRVDAFTDSHERLLTTVAPQIATAIDHARQYEQIRLAASAVRERLSQLQERTTQLEALNVASVSLSSTLRSSEVFSLVADQLQRVVPYDHLNLWVRDDASGQMVPAASHGNGLNVLDTPLYTQLIASRGAIVVPDTTADVLLRVLGKGSWLGLPVLSRGQLVGLIGLDKEQPGFYNDQYAALADGFAAQVANAIENARLFENSLRRVKELNDRASRFAMLNRIASELAGTLDVTALAQTGAKELAAALDSETVAVALLEDDDVTVVHYPSNGKAKAPAISHPLIERTRTSLAPARLDPAEATQADWVGTGLTNGVVWPLIIEGSVRGLVVAAGTRLDQTYSDDTVELGSTITQHIAAAIQNAGLYQRTQKRLVELGSLSQINRAVSGTIERQKLYNTVREQLHGLLGANTLCVALYDEVRGEISYPLIEREGVPVEAKPHAPSGLMWHILRTQQPLLLVGAAEDKRKVQASVTADKANVIRGKSFLGAPLIVNEKAIGVIAVADSQSGVFTAEHERLLTNISSQVASAVENTRLFESSTQRVEELGARVQTLALVNRVSTQLGSLLDSKRVLTVGAQELADALSAERVAILAFGGDKPSIIATHPQGTVESKLLSVEGDWLVEQARVKLQPITLEATHEALTEPVHTAWLGEGLQGALLLPLSVGEDLIGLAAVGLLSLRDFTAEELTLAMQIAAQIASALHHTWQYEGARAHSESLNERAQHLSILARASSEMSRTLEAAQVLQIGLRELSTAVQADVVYATTLDDGQKLVARKLRGEPADAVAPVEGDAVIEEVRETLAPISLAETGRKASWLGAGLKSAVVLPLAVRGKLVGVVAIAAINERLWSDSDMELANALAAEIAVALNNARLHERTLKRLVDLGAISQSTRAVSGSVELGKLYDAVRTQAGSLVGANTVSLALYDEARNQVSFPVSIKNGQAYDSAPTAPNPVLWHIIQTQQSLRWPGEDETRAKELGMIHNGDESNGSNGAYGKSYMGVPLVVGKKTIGVLSVADDERDDAFDSEHERVLQTLATQVASAIDSARLYETAVQKAQLLEDRLQKISAVNRTAVELNRSLDSAHVLNVGLKELRSLPGVTGVVAATQTDNQWTLSSDGVATGNAAFPGEHDPLVEYVRESRAPMAIANLSNDSLAKSAKVTWLGKAAKSAIVLPLIADNNWLGVVAVVSNSLRTFTTEEADLAASMAGQMAQVLDHARKYEAAERRLIDAATVNGALRAVQRTTDLPQLWDALRSQVTSLTGASTMALQLYDEPSGQVSVPLFVRDGQSIETESRIPGAVTRHVILTQRPVLSNGNLREAATAAGVAITDETGGEVVSGASYMAVPLILGDHVTGVLAVADATAGTFTDKHVAGLSALASPFAAAIENGRTLARTRGELAREQHVMEQARATTQTLETQLQEAAAELARLREHQASVVEQGRVTSKTLETQLQQAEAEMNRLRQEQTAALELAKAETNRRLQEAAQAAEALKEEHAAAAFQAQTLSQRQLQEAANEVERLHTEHEAELHQSQLAAQREIQQATSEAERLRAEHEAELRQAQLAAQREIQQAASEAERLRTEHEAELRQAQLAAQREIQQAIDETERIKEEQAEVEQELKKTSSLLVRLQDRETGYLRREAEFEFLVQFTEELTADDPTTLLKRALLLAGQAINADFGAIFLRTPNGSLKQSAAFGPDRTLQGLTTTFAPDEGLVGWVYSNHTNLRQTRLADDGRWRSRPIVDDKQFQSALVLPLLAMGRAEGVLAFLNPADRAFTDIHEEIMGVVARQLALAVRKTEAPTPVIIAPSDRFTETGLTTASTVVMNANTAVLPETFAPVETPVVADMVVEPIVEPVIEPVIEEADNSEPEETIAPVIVPVVPLMPEEEVSDITATDPISEDAQVEEASALSDDDASDTGVVTALNDDAVYDNDVDPTYETAVVEMPEAQPETQSEQPAEITTADVDNEATLPLPIVPVPFVADSDATMVTTRRAAFAEDAALNVSPDQLQHIDDDKEYNAPPPAINPLLLIGVVVVLIVGAFLITFVITSGGLSGLFGGTQQPTQVVVVTNPPTNDALATNPVIVPTEAIAATSTATATATATEALPTETATATEVVPPTATAGPTLPPGVIALGTIQVTAGTSARLRAAPNGAVVGSVPDDEAVQVLQGKEFVDGISWIQIRVPDGQVGWIAESLVEITTSP